MAVSSVNVTKIHMEDHHATDVFVLANDIIQKSLSGVINFLKLDKHREVELSKHFASTEIEITASYKLN